MTERVPDCQRCGACCRNPRHNRAHGILDYVDVVPTDRLFQRRGLRERWTFRTDEGTHHMKLRRDGRCEALEGDIARFVSCGIYAFRPQVCRNLQAGTPQCLEARAEAGLGP